MLKSILYDVTIKMTSR